MCVEKHLQHSKLSIKCLLLLSSSLSSIYCHHYHFILRQLWVEEHASRSDSDVKALKWHSIFRQRQGDRETGMAGMQTVSRERGLTAILGADCERLWVPGPLSGWFILQVTGVLERAGILTCFCASFLFRGGWKMRHPHCLRPRC